MRRLALVTALLAGTIAGAAATSALRDGEVTVVLPPATVAAIDREPVPAPRGGVLLVWTTGGLPAGMADRVAATGMGPVSAVSADTVWMTGSTDTSGRPVDVLDAGFAIPLDAVAFDCETWSPLVPLAEATAVCALGPGEALLGATSARLRRLDRGGTITLDGGRELRVAGVIADEAVGAAELVLASADAPAAGVRTERYVLVQFEGDRSAAEHEIRAAVGDMAVRVRGPGETPWLRHGDAVLPPSVLKVTFGEWSARRLGGGRLELDAAWMAEWLVSVDMPVLGRIRCHRDLVPVLRSALTELADRGLLETIDRTASGCWNPRTIAGGDHPSRHAWGAAVDLVPMPAAPGLVEVMERWGLTWGGRWLDPDPVHFEFVRAGKP
ncbi:MAG TPA: M15 family metallopeptidase [Acidimicrobiales bacterium]|nr:M15 family metallopeptidase [Acidimicrobiales bacterium]